MFKARELTEGVTFYSLPTKQFKTITLSIKFEAPLTENSAGQRTVLSNILQFSNQLTPTNTSFRQVLDELYGASIYLDTSKRGERHYVHLNADFVNDSYLNGSSVTESVFELIQAILWKPSFLSDTFDASIFLREKKQVISRLDSLYEDKARFAQQRLLEIIRPNHAASISASGKKELIESMTIEELRETYTSMIQNDKISIYLVGDIDENQWDDLLATYLQFESRTVDSKPVESIFAHTPVGATAETQEMKQGKLHIAYEMSVTGASPQFPTMQLLNGIFGAYPHSKLFTNVREKESLAYYASSSFASSYGLLFATSGIDQAQKDKAEALIDAQLEEIRLGHISDLEFIQTKSMLKNQLLEIRDSARGMIEVYDSYREIDPEFSIEGWASKWEHVTKESIQELAKDIRKVHTYFLTGKEGN